MPDVTAVDELYIRFFGAHCLQRFNETSVTYSLEAVHFDEILLCWQLCCVTSDCSDTSNATNKASTTAGDAANSPELTYQVVRHVTVITG